MQLGFLLLAALILAAAMALIGELVTDLTSRSITAGVADTAAASLDIMLADELAEIGPVRPLTSSARQDLDSLFSVANDAEVNKLIEIRLRNPDGSLLYESLGGLLDPAPASDALAGARAGKVTSRLVNLPLAPVGPLQPATLPVLKVITPVHDTANGTVEATAELYFAAGGLVDLESRSQWRVWTSVAAIGGLAIVALFVLVDWAARTIATQRARLAASLAASQELSAENAQLRQQGVALDVGAGLHAHGRRVEAAVAGLVFDAVVAQPREGGVLGQGQEWRQVLAREGRWFRGASAHRHCSFGSSSPAAR